MTSYFYILALLLSCLGLTALGKGVNQVPTKLNLPSPKPDIKPPLPIKPPAPAKVVQVAAKLPTNITPTYSSKGANLNHPVALNVLDPEKSAHLARVTAYWSSEGDYNTRHGVSATGIRLHGGHCAVDPRIIPYGSVVDIPGMGRYLAVDTGSAVISRKAARISAGTEAEQSALVVDLYFETRKEGQQFAANGPTYASISWWAPDSTASDAKKARSVFADENWDKINSKQL